MMVVGGHLKGDGEAHDDDSNVEGDAVVGSEHGQEERANDAPGDAGDDDLRRVDQAGDEDAAESAGDEGGIVEDVEQVRVGRRHLEGPAEGVGVRVALEEAFETAGHDVVDVDQEEERAPPQELLHPSFI